MGVYENFIYLRTYSRFIPELQRRETWEETIERYCTFIFNETKNCQNIPAKTKKKIKDYMLTKGVMASMRLVWSAGENARRDNIAAYGCSGFCSTSLEGFGEAMYIELAGTGVGFSVEAKWLEQLPEIKKQRNLPILRHVVGDSRLGWKKAVDFGIQEWFSGRDAVFDYSQVRPAGTPLVISGGYASGPEPLARCLEFLREVIIEAQDRKLKSIEVFDMMCEIGSAVVCGGVRRTAMICLCDVDDVDMQNAKQGNFHPRRFMANISAVYRKKPDVLKFTQEFIDMAKSGSGERGIFNLVAARKRSPKRRDKSAIVISNPCLRGDMRLFTDNGYIPISELDGASVNVINKDGAISVGNVWCSGEKRMIELRFGGIDVNSIFCTPDHRFMLDSGEECEASDTKGKKLKPFYTMKTDFDKDDFLAGFIQGDGCTNRINSPIHRGLEVRFGEKDLDVANMYGQVRGIWYSREAYDVAAAHHLDAIQLPFRKLPPREFMSPNFLSGLFSANGCVINGYRVAIKSTCYDMLHELRAILADWFEIESYITTNKPTMVKFENGDYLCRESYDLNISRFRSIVKFAENISFAHSYKRDALTKLIADRNPTIRSVRDAGSDLVYDFSEPLTNWGIVEGFVTHNCGETLLRDMGLCNLTEVVIRADDDFDSVADKIRTATWMGCIQSTLTYFPHLRPEWAKNAEEERLLGVSLTGLCDNINLITPETLRHWRTTAVKTAKQASAALGINMPAAITLGKPSGTVSQMVDCSSGMHSRWANYYIRRVRISMHDALFRMMVDQGMPYELDKGNHDTAIFSFPMRSPDGAKTREQDTAIGQLEWYRMLVENWAEQNMSCTIFVKDDEWLEVIAYVYKHFDTINGVAFFPYENKSYAQAPYEEVSEIEYHKLLRELPVLDFSKLSEYENTDTTTGSREFACAGNSCEL